MSPLTLFSVPQWIAIAAVALLFLMIGALINQILTRRRWESLDEMRIREHQQLVANLEQQLEEARLQIDDREDKLTFLQTRLEDVSQKYGEARSEAARIPALEQSVSDNHRALMEAKLDTAKALAMHQSQQARFEAERTAFEEKLKLLETAEQRLNQQFENLANKIFEQKAEQLKGSNLLQLDSVIGPLKQQIDGFRKQVSESYSLEQAERSSLKHQLEQLAAVNLKMSQDAINLTNALKGDNKAQGNWGEVILERVLTESGLREGHEYHTQQELKSESGQKFKPDVVVHLPGDKDVVIDAKMSLTAYERYFNADNDADKAIALKEHVQSLRSHIKLLSQKDYHRLYGLKSLDYVLMFVPVEPAFLLALEQDPTLVNYALEHNIMLASPTNLLVALRTIHNIWRYEYQDQNARRIATAAGRIYDKLCGFVEDMDKLGRTLDGAQKSFQTAMGKLSTGKGNLIRQAHQMHQLGVDASKQLDRQLLDMAMDDSHDEATSEPEATALPKPASISSHSSGAHSLGQANGSSGRSEDLHA
ncbi:DNA recombination protein RmuC [Shewanella sp. JM162201]|uniref:DNA recombination protein RmuC n=1 Tax=Shewanella jiangmenensis TaxID=2837387 RepID=A0ABS5V507_9GAMM|nr:DNA recombination protein RmuC [Shewanella jiangmenensis]MBT1445544.1 DNA recombination protein RmuC [Shewanella jiangmenensis]